MENQTDQVNPGRFLPLRVSRDESTYQAAAFTAQKFRRVSKKNVIISTKDGKLSVFVLLPVRSTVDILSQESHRGIKPCGK